MLAGTGRLLRVFAPQEGGELIMLAPSKKVRRGRLWMLKSNVGAVGCEDESFTTCVSKS